MSLGLGLICFLFAVAFLGLGTWSIFIAVANIKRSRNIFNQFSDIVDNERTRINAGDAQSETARCKFCGASIPAGARCGACGAEG